MKPTDDEMVLKVVQLGNIIRSYRANGNLLSVPPPTINGYLSFIRLKQSLPHFDLEDVALVTLLGNASRDDRKYVKTVCSDVFGMKADQEDDLTMGGHLF